MNWVFSTGEVDFLKGDPGRRYFIMSSNEEWPEEAEEEQLMAKQNEIKGKDVKSMITDEVARTVPAPSGMCTHDQPADACKECARVCRREGCSHPLGEHATGRPHLCLAENCACIAFDSGEVIVDE